MGFESFAASSDFHGDRHDPVARAAFKLFVEDYKPKHRWFLGDLFDLRALRIGADADEKLHSLQSDFDTGMEFMEEYRPDVVTLGNHDQRLWDAAEKDGLRRTGPIADLARILLAQWDKTVKKMGVRVLPYDKRKGVYRYNGLAGTHGFDHAEPAQMAQVYGNVIYGHGHAILSAASPSEETKVGRMIGSLALRDMVYNRAQVRTLRQQNGWAYGGFLPRNRFALQQVELIDGQFSYAKTLTTVRV